MERHNIANRTGVWIVIVVIATHIILGAVLIITNVPTRTSFIASVLILFNDDPHSVYHVGLLFLGVGGLALMGMFQTNRLASIILVSFQQMLMLFSLANSFGNIIAGKYSDGYIPMPGPGGEVTFNSHLFIFNDQVLPVIVAMAHTISLFIIYKRFQ